jgi:hypothetical protein
VAGVVVTLLAPVCSAYIFDGNVREHRAWLLVGSTSVFCRFRNRRIHYPARVHSRAREIVRRQHRFLVRPSFHAADAATQTI